jgi:tetratricopeptide (TPR) repeat protein
VLWWYRRSWARSLAFSLGCFAVMLVPVLGFLNIYFMRYSLVADHWQYFSLPAITALAGAAGCRAYEKLSLSWRRPALLACGIGLAGGLGCLTFAQTMIYRDSSTLWADVLKKNPACWLAYENTGVGLAARGQYAQAVEYFRKALAIEPNHAEGHYDLAKALSRMSGAHKDEPIRELREAIRIQPLHSQALTHLAWIRATDPDSRNRNGKEAVALAERACEITRNRELLPLASLAVAYAEAGQFDRALQVAGQGEQAAIEQGDAKRASIFAALSVTFRRGMPFREIRPVTP